MLPDIIEVTFKRNRKVLCVNNLDSKIDLNEYIVIEVEKGIDLGQVTHLGRLVMLKNIKNEPCKILRKATDEDMDHLRENRDKETSAFLVGREMIDKHGLNMKLVDVEYQFDENKLTFYFTSDKRVDFRELVKDLAAKYRTRIELRQIGVREEARKLGGLGVCGNGLCCTTFMGNFAQITTQDAKDQNLPMNPSKISGICSRLKCCLLFEKGFYEASLKNFPALETKISTDRGPGIVDKVNIFDESVVLRFEDEEYEQYSLSEINALLQLTSTH